MHNSDSDSKKWQIGILIGIHAAISLGLSKAALFWNESTLVMAVALILGQVSLLSIWAALSSLPVWTKFLLPSLGLLVGWYFLSQLLPWGLSDEASAAWAFALLIQALTIFVFIESYRRTQSIRAGLDSRQDSLTAGPFTFGLRTMVLWTTVTALIFGFIQLGRSIWGWDFELIAKWEYLLAMPVIGLINAVIAVVWLWIVATTVTVKHGVQVIVAIGLSVASALVLHYFSNWLTGSVVLSLTVSMILVFVQSGVVLVSLIAAKIRGSVVRGKIAVWMKVGKQRELVSKLD